MSDKSINTRQEIAERDDGEKKKQLTMAKEIMKRGIWGRNKTKQKDQESSKEEDGQCREAARLISTHPFSTSPHFSLEQLPKVFGLMAPFLLLVHQIQEDIPKHNASLGSRLN